MGFESNRDKPGASALTSYRVAVYYAIVTHEIIRKAIVLALLVGPVGIALLLAAAAARGREHEGEGLRDDRAYWSFAFYVILLGVVTLAPPPFSPSNGHSGTNFLPLLPSIRCFVPNPGQPPTTEFCIRTIMGNIAMFVPLGLMLPLISRKHLSAGRLLVVALIASVAIELLQYTGSRFGSARWSDVDDILFNLVGALIGYALFRLGRTTGRWSESQAA